MRRMRDRLPHIESSLVKVGNAHVDQVKIVQVCVEDIEGCQFGEYIPIPKPYFDTSATKFRRFRNQNQTRFRNQEKALPQPKKDDSATKKKTIPQPKKKIPQPKKENFATKKNNFATTIRATQKVHMHPVIKNALPNSFGVTKGYWSGLGPFKIGSFQQHDLAANI